jgi:molecular chaperone GrpE (heat shock protein)
VSRGTGEAVRVSHTEATLDARGQFAALRTMLAGYMQNEVDRLVDVLTDAYHARDGMVPDEVHADVRKDYERLEEDIGARDEKIEKLEEKLSEERALFRCTDSELHRKVADLLDAQSRHDAKVKLLEEKLAVEQAYAQRMGRECAAAMGRVGALNIRMASWLENRTAAETADHYREKYDAALRACNDTVDRLHAAYVTATRKAGKRKAVSEGIQMVRDIFEGTLR